MLLLFPRLSSAIRSPMMSAGRVIPIAFKMPSSISLSRHAPGLPISAMVASSSRSTVTSPSRNTSYRWLHPAESRYLQCSRSKEEARDCHVAVLKAAAIPIAAIPRASEVTINKAKYMTSSFEAAKAAICLPVPGFVK